MGVRKILLNSIYYDIVGEITESVINPIRGKLGSAAGLEYSDFQGANFEEWHDFRNGIGLESALPDESARQWWSEGVDVSSSRSAVLGGEVVGAGVLGKTPVKIIDFNGYTYAIASDKVSRWNDTSKEWEEQDAGISLVLEDCEDAWDEKVTTGVTSTADTADKKVGSASASMAVGEAVGIGLLATEVIATPATETLRPNGAGSETSIGGQYPDSTYHWDKVDETGGGDGDTTYVFPAGSNYVRDLFALPAHSGSGTITKVTVYFRIRGETGYEPAYAKPSIKSNSTVTDGTEVEQYSTAWTLRSQSWATNPADSAAWEWADIDALEAGVSIKSVNTRVTQVFVVVSYITGVVDISAYDDLKIWIKSTIALAAGDLQLMLAPDAECATPDETINIPAITTANTWILLTLPLANPQNDVDEISIGLNMAVNKGAFTVNVDQVLAGAILDGAIDACSFTDTTDTYLVVSSATEAIYYDTTNGWRKLTGCLGYLCPFAGRLYSINTDGAELHFSPKDDIDGTWDDAASIKLSGDFKAIYGLFSGKLLTTAEATLYMVGIGEKGGHFWSIDLTNSIAYEQEIEFPPYTYAGKVGMYWNANIWIATGAGLMKVGANMATPIGVDQDDGLPSGYQGYVSDMTTCGNWLVFSVNGGSSDKSSIFKRNASMGGNLQVYTTSAVDNAIGCIHYSPSSMFTNGRLWWGEGTGVKYMMMPDLTSNVKQISTYQYVATSGKSILPRFRGLAAISKTALGVKAVTKSCDTDEYITIYYRTDDTASWGTALGTFKTSPLPTALTFGSDLGETFYTIQFAYTLQRGTTNTDSPELESLMFYWRENITPIHSWTFYIDLRRDPDVSAKLTALKAVGALGTLVVFSPDGDTAISTYNVKLTQYPFAYARDIGSTEALIQLTVSEVFNG